MSINQKLYQSQQLKQEMKINPRLYQAMELLYMPLLDLQQHLKQELAENPFLELTEPDVQEEVELKDNGEDCFDDEECASNFCESSERFECSGSGDPCTEETVLDDCPVGEFCFEQFSSVCADSDLSVEVCDGQ